MNHIEHILSSQKRGEAQGITSICSANPWVLKAVMRNAATTNVPVLIEATCNQVNQFGGYTGMTPVDFVRYVREIANKCGFPSESIILGGDHLGPNVWQSEPADSAMQKSIQMMSAYVQAGFSKIHLDASMKLADDPDGALDPETSARRAAILAKTAEAARIPDRPPPYYVIGTEVPVPGGAQEHEDGVSVTSIGSVQQTIEIAHDAFRREGLEAAWERVIAVVVQPGVEFGDDFVLEYDSGAARALAQHIESQPRLIYEAHSTDYQTRDSLKNLVRDHFAILKVGPGLTFALREAIYALAAIEDELFSVEERSNIVTVLDEAMLHHPDYWRKYYPGAAEYQAFARKYSLSDRIRYYWPMAEVEAALNQLLKNLALKPIPWPLLSQFSPAQYQRIRQGQLQNMPQEIIFDKIAEVLADYDFACALS
jgi:D-tagatose-1,6-bisphosphate aldolase subunit GatZ/KbaZ